MLTKGKFKGSTILRKEKRKEKWIIVGNGWMQEGVCS